MKIITLLFFRQLTVVNREMKEQKNSSFLSSPSSSQTNVVLINVIHIRWKKEATAAALVQQKAMKLNCLETLTIVMVH